MKRPIALLSLTLLVTPLAACVEDGYGYTSLSVGASYPYGGYYDDFYGPIYDGYWGSNGYFYYRSHQNDHFRRGAPEHFRREGGAPGGRFHPMQGDFRPQPHQRAPHFGGGRGPGGNRGGDRGHH